MMLILDQNKRISAEQALTYPWITSNNLKDFLIIKQSSTSLNCIILNLKNFQNRKKFQQATLAFIVHHLSSTEEINNLRKIFETFDENGDGRLTYNELFDGLIQTKGEF